MIIEAPIITPRLRYLLTAIALTGAYFVVGKLSLLLATLHPSASPVWPPTGMAIATLLLLGKKHWPAICIGAFLVNAATAGSVATSVAIAVGNGLEALVACSIMERFAGGKKAFEKVNTVLAFLFLAIFPAAILSATIGLGALTMGGFASEQNFLPIWFTWWLGDVTGACVFTPLVVVWAQSSRHQSTPREEIETVSLMTFLCMFTAILFSTSYFPYPYLSLIPILWIAIRLTPRIVATSVVILSCIAIAGTLRDTGPFAGMDPNTSLLFLQAYIAIVSWMALSFAASQQERRLFEQSLEYKVKERTEQLNSAREEDRAKFLQLKNIIDQLRVATVAADEHMRILHANRPFHALFHIAEDDGEQTLPQVFNASRRTFAAPEETLASLLQLLGERRRNENRQFTLSNGNILFCDYTPINDEGIHRGHLLVFHERVEERSSPAHGHQSDKELSMGADRLPVR